ncbi:MAG: hypothetical protein AB7U61_16430, partial [Methylocystis sp.]
MTAELKRHLQALSPKQALVPAPPPTGKDEWPLVTAREADGATTIARTKQYFPPVPGPALFGVDIDAKTIPAHTVKKIETAGGLSKVFESVFPEFVGATCVRRPSVSSGIVVSGDEPPSRSTGAHWYFFVLDGEDVAGFAKRFFDRLSLAGFLWGEVSEAGKVLYRGLFDLAASSDPSRLFFEANAIFESPELEYVKDARAVKIVPGGFLDTRALPPLTAEEAEELEKIKAQIARDLEPECRKKRELWEERRIDDQVRKGKSPEAARKSVTGAVESHVLSADFEIEMDDGRTVSVKEICENSAEFHKKTCADPLEPEYHGGRNIAVIYADGAYVRIVSHAHGGIDYRSETYVEAWLAKWFEDLGDPEPEPPSASPNSSRSGPVAITGRIDPQTIPLREFVIEPRIPVGDVSLHVGEPGANKSGMSLRDALAVASGDEELLTGGIERFPESLHLNGAVLIYNAEDSLA